MLDLVFWNSLLAIQDMNNFAASGLGVLAKMAPVCAQLTYWSLGVLLFHHESDPAPEVNVSARDELVELC